MTLFSLDLGAVQSVAEVGVVAIGALLAAALTGPPTGGRYPAGQSSPCRFPKLGPQRSPLRLPGSPSVYVETAESVEAWIASPRVARSPWVSGLLDHVWTRDDVAAWKEEMRDTVLASLRVSERRVHLDLGRCEAIAITGTSSRGTRCAVELLIESLRDSNVEVIDRRVHALAAQQNRSSDVRALAATWFALERRDPPGRVAVGEGPVPLHATKVHIGARLCIPSVDLSLPFAGVTPEYDDDPVRVGVAGVVQVRLLGDIDVVGAVLRPKQCALLVYLALHPDATSEEIEQALWPECSGSARKRLHVTASQIRSVSGKSALPAAVGNRYRTGPAISTDLADFESLVAQPSASDQERAAKLAAALELVRGPVCRYGDEVEDSYRWVDLEYWAANVEATVTRTALELADLSRQAADLAQAAWALRQGLLAAPLDAALVEALLDVLAEDSDSGGVHDAYDDYVGRLDAFDLGPPSESTVGAHRRATERCLAVADE